MRISVSEYREMIAKPKRRNKYNAQKTEFDGIVFDSKAEVRYYSELKIREKAGEISGLVLQREFPLLVNGEEIGTWKADFCFWDHVEDRFRVIDVKGVQTREFKRTKKHVEALYRVTVEVVER